ncbi:MAG: SBBP repeat-containing protein [Ignavibacteria bacterium]|nr:SBBP repeat-containing protein [Ignavibacteria bacterium]
MRVFYLLYISLIIMMLNAVIYNSGLAQIVNQVWAANYNGASQGNDVASDNSGNIYVTGYANNLGILTIKYNSSGQQMWSRIESGSSLGLKIAVDINQDIIVCGFEGLSNVLIVMKFNSSGDTLWTRRYIRPQSAQFSPINLKIDYDGSIYITLTTSVGGIDDFSILKYLSNGDLQLQRHYSYGLNYHDTANDITLGKDNYFYVTGFSYYPPEIIGFVIKFDKVSVDTVWSEITASYIPTDITLDKKGIIYTTGNNNGNYYIDRINPDGQTAWTRIYYDSGGTSKSIGVDTNDNIYVSGYQYQSKNYMYKI